MATQLSTPTQLKNLATNLEAKEFEQNQRLADILFEATCATHDAFFLAWRNLQIVKDAIDGLTEGQQREDLRNLADEVSKLVDLKGALEELSQEATRLYRSANGVE